MTTDYYGDDAKFIEVSGSETKAWEAEKVYTMTDGYDDNARLVVYEDIVLFIETDIEFNDKVSFSCSFNQNCFFIDLVLIPSSLSKFRA